jgi:hypothetical protein
VTSADHDTARYETSDGEDQPATGTDRVDPADRQPKGDHNRRLALFIEPADFAMEAGITEEQLRDYERTPPDGKFDLEVARRVGLALQRLEQATPPAQKIIS